MTDTATATISETEAAELRRQISELRGLIAQQPGAPDEASKDAGQDAPPRTFPEGWVYGDPAPRKERERNAAIAKIKARARDTGGRWDPEYPSNYGHRKAKPPYITGCPMVEQNPAKFTSECQRTCWTPEREARELSAVKLYDLLGDRKVVPLSKPEKKGATLADVLGNVPADSGPNALMALLARGLQPVEGNDTPLESAAPTIADVRGSYMPEGEAVTEDMGSMNRGSKRRSH